MNPNDPPEGDAPMDAARLRALLDAYGARPERWPPAERAAALALLAASAEARAARAEAAALDALLDLAAAPAPSAALVGRILGDAAAPRGWRRALAALWPGAPGRPAAALAAAAAAGLALGLAVPPTLTGAADAAATELAELAGGDPVVAALLDETPETLP